MEIYVMSWCPLLSRSRMHPHAVVRYFSHLHLIHRMRPDSPLHFTYVHLGHRPEPQWSGNITHQSLSIFCHLPDLMDVVFFWEVVTTQSRPRGQWFTVRYIQLRPVFFNDYWSFSWNSTETCWEVLFGARFRMLCRWFQIHIIILYHRVFPSAASNFDDSAREVALKSWGSLPSGNDWQLAIEDGHRNVVSFPMQTYGDFPYLIFVGIMMGNLRISKMNWAPYWLVFIVLMGDVNSELSLPQRTQGWAGVQRRMHPSFVGNFDGQENAGFTCK